MRILSVGEETLQKYRDVFRDALLKDCIPFWQTHGLDREYGGLYTYLAQDGTRCSSVKSVWHQGRYMWLMAHLCNQYGVRDEWLDAARNCGRFMDEHCFDRDGRMYFLVTGDGRPVRKRRYFFSESFYTMAFAEYARVTGDREAIEKARGMYDFVTRLYTDPDSDPHKVYPKYEPQTCRWRAFGGPMIMLNVSNVMRQCDPQNAVRYDDVGNQYLNDVFRYFYREDYECVFENVADDGTLMLDIPQGRLVNPGHSIEAAWFLLNEAHYRKDDEIARKALNIIDWSLKLGWDETHSGIYYFVDRMGFPPEQYEHDMKLWWPQNEAIIATLMAYELTNDKKWFDWFECILRYYQKFFRDAEYGEVFGYLHSDNTVQRPAAKGNYYKGAFHNARMNAMCDQVLTRMLDNLTKNTAI